MDNNAREKKYIWDEKHVFAIKAAVAVNRPLLIRGEPGIGKSSLARAAATKLERHFISEVITAKTEPNDLLWQFDGVMRLGDATATCNMTLEEVKKRLDRKRYTAPGVLWWAFQPEQALLQYEDCPAGPCPSAKIREKIKAEAGQDSRNNNGWVVLIDEIDKADASVPNSLLGALADKEFFVPGFDAPVKQDQDAPAPLIIFTTNEERELPRAFLRRCFVLHMDFPKESISVSREKVVHWLKERAKLHLTKKVNKSIDLSMERIAGMLLDERSKMKGRHVPGLSEYIDFVCAFEEMFEDEQNKDYPRGAQGLMEEIASFTLQKNARF